MEDLVSEAVEALETAHETNDSGMLWTGGKDSMVMLHLWRNHLASDQPPLLVVDTGNQFESVYDFREEISEEWDLELDVRRNEDFIENVIENGDDERGYAWDGPKTEGCCGALKIDVISDFITSGYDTLVVGRRSADVGHDLPVYDDDYREPIVHDRIHPLANWSDAQIKSYLMKHRIALPSVYDEGYEHTDCVDCVSQGEEGDDWSGVSQEKKEQLNDLRDMGYM